MGTMIKSSEDVVGFLKQQHKEVKQMLEQVLAAKGAARSKLFATLRRTLEVHEAAEEEIVHPAARKALPDGDSIVEARLLEEKKAKKVIAELSKLEIDSPEFETKFKSFQKAVLAHAESEEKDEFDKLGENLEPARLESMRKEVERAESAAEPR